MSELGGELNIEQGLKDYKEGGTFTLRAPGWYKAVLLKDEKKPCKGNAANKLLEGVFQFQDGTGDEIINRFNIKHTSKKCQGIGRAQLCAVASAVGHGGTFSNTDVLKGRPLMIKLGVESNVTTKIDEATGALELDSATGKTKIWKSNVVVGYAKVGSTPANKQPEQEAAAEAPVAQDSAGPSDWD